MTDRSVGYSTLATVRLGRPSKSSLDCVCPQRTAHAHPRGAVAGGVASHGGREQSGGRRRPGVASGRAALVYAHPLAAGKGLMDKGLSVVLSSGYDYQWADSRTARSAARKSLRTGYLRLGLFPLLKSSGLIEAAGAPNNLSRISEFPLLKSSGLIEASANA